MEKSTAPGANEKQLSRKKFFTASGLAALAGGLAVEKSLANTTKVGGAAVASEGGYRSKSFTGTLNRRGNLAFSHGLGASLPANILSVSAFIKLPDGKVRNVPVQHVDDKVIAVAAGVPNGQVKVGVVYSTDDASW